MESYPNYSYKQYGQVQYLWRKATEYLEKKKPRHALQILEEAYNIALANNDKIKLAQIFRELSEAQFMIGNYEKALEIIKNPLLVNSTISQEYYIMKYMVYLGDINLAMKHYIEVRNIRNSALDGEKLLIAGLFIQSEYSSIIEIFKEKIGICNKNMAIAALYSIQNIYGLEIISSLDKIKEIYPYLYKKIKEIISFYNVHKIKDYQELLEETLALNSIETLEKFKLKLKLLFRLKENKDDELVNRDEIVKIFAISKLFNVNNSTFLKKFKTLTEETITDLINDLKKDINGFIITEYIETEEALSRFMISKRNILFELYTIQNSHTNAIDLLRNSDHVVAYYEPTYLCSFSNENNEDIINKFLTLISLSKNKLTGKDLYIYFLDYVQPQSQIIRNLRTDLINYFEEQLNSFFIKHGKHFINYIEEEENLKEKVWQYSLCKTPLNTNITKIRSAHQEEIFMKEFCKNRFFKEQLSKLLYNAENMVRKNIGLLQIGAGSLPESYMLLTLKNIFRNYDVIAQGTPLWLDKLRYDAYIPQLNLAIEYQGAQHFKPVGKFGGEIALIETQRRDKKKLELSKQNNVHLEYILYTEDIDTRINEIVKNYLR